MQSQWKQLLFCDIIVLSPCILVRNSTIVRPSPDRSIPTPLGDRHQPAASSKPHPSRFSHCLMLCRARELGFPAPERTPSGRGRKWEPQVLPVQAFPAVISISFAPPVAGKPAHSPNGSRAWRYQPLDTAFRLSECVMEEKTLEQSLSEVLLQGWEISGTGTGFLIVTDWQFPDKERIEVYARRVGERDDLYVVGDGGEIFNTLFSHGIDLSKDERGMKMFTRRGGKLRRADCGLSTRKRGQGGRPGLRDPNDPRSDKGCLFSPLAQAGSSRQPALTSGRKTNPRRRERGVFRPRFPCYKGMLIFKISIPGSLRNRWMSPWCLWMIIFAMGRSMATV